MKAWLLLTIVWVLFISVGTAVAGDEKPTLNAQQTFRFVEEIQHEALVGLINKDSSEIIPTGISVLESFHDKSAVINPPNCPYDPPRYKNCRNKCLEKTDLRERFVCFGVCSATCPFP